MIEQLKWRKHLILIACGVTGVSLCLSMPGAAQAQTDFIEQGITAYRRGDHEQAADILAYAVVTPAGKSARVHYYLANALLHSGQRAKARRYYQSALSFNPPEPLAGDCRRGLSLCRESQGTRGQSSAAGGSGSQNNRAGNSQNIKPGIKASRNITQSRRASTADPRDANLIRLLRQTDDTAGIQLAVLQALACVPHGVKDQLHAFGFKVTITPTIRELDPSQAESRPSAYIHGGGIDNCPGYYDPNNREIVIPEKVSYSNSPPTLNCSVIDTMLHELGHAYDHATGQTSLSEQFRKIYSEENNRLSNTERKAHYYFTQGGDHGPREAFAELFSIRCVAHAGLEHPNSQLGQHFPTCFQYIKDCMN